MNLQYILALIQAALSALSASGITDTRVKSITALLQKGLSLVGTGVSAGTNFVIAMKALTAQVKAMHDAGVDDLTDEQQADIDGKVQAALAELQSD